MNTLVQTRSKDLLVVFGVALILGIISLFEIRFPLMPVPILFTPQAVLFFAALFGRKGAMATWAYLSYGLAGLPVFTGGSMGLAHLLGPTGGYLIGYVVAAFFVAYALERLEKKSPAKVFLVMLGGNALIFAFGLPYLALFVGAENAPRLGLYPFIGGDILKVMLATQLLKKCQHFSKA